MIKSEESVDPRHTYWNGLNDNRKVLQQLAHHHFLLPYFDSFRITRMWKIFNDSYDGTHFYSMERKFVGNIASTTAANLMVDFVFQTLDGQQQQQQQQGPNKSSTPLLESIPTTTSVSSSSSSSSHIILQSSSLQSLPYTVTVSSCKDDGEIIALSTKRNPELFFVLNSSKHSFPSWDAFQALKLDHGETNYLDTKEFEAFPLGAAMPHASVLNQRKKR